MARLIFFFQYKLLERQTLEVKHPIRQRSYIDLTKGLIYYLSNASYGKLIEGKERNLNLYI
jgi:hypothetical protein